MRVAPLIAASLSAALAAPTFDRTTSPGMSLITRATNANVRYFTMYREPSFKGTWVDYTINYNTCLSLLDHQTTADTWFSSFQGLQDANPTPITCRLSRNADCTGESLTTESNLVSFGNLDNLVQSIKCTWSLQTTENSLLDDKFILLHKARSIVDKRDDPKLFDWKLFLFYNGPGYTGGELDLMMLNNLCYDFNSLYTASVSQFLSFRASAEHTWTCSFYHGIHCANEFIRTWESLVELGSPPDNLPQSMRCYWDGQGPGDLATRTATGMNVDGSIAEHDVVTRQENTKYFTFYPGTNFTHEGLELKLPNDRCKDISQWQTDDSLKFQSFLGFVTGRNWTCVLSRTTNCTGTDITTTTDIPDFGTFDKQIQSVRCTWSWTANYRSTRDIRLVTRQGNAEFFSICPEANYHGVCKSWSVGKDGCNNFDASDSWSSFAGGQGDVYQCYLYTSFDCQGPNLMVVNDTPQIPAPFDNNVRSLKCTWGGGAAISLPSGELSTRAVNEETMVGLFCPQTNYGGTCLALTMSNGQCYKFTDQLGTSATGWRSFKGISDRPYTCTLFDSDNCFETVGTGLQISNSNAPDLGAYNGKVKSAVCTWDFEATLVNSNDVPITFLSTRNINAELLTIMLFPEVNYNGTPVMFQFEPAGECITWFKGAWSSFGGSLPSGDPFKCYLVADEGCPKGAAALILTQNTPDLGDWKNKARAIKCKWGSHLNDPPATSLTTRESNTDNVDANPVSSSSNAPSSPNSKIRLMAVTLCSEPDFQGTCKSMLLNHTDRCNTTASASEYVSRSFAGTVGVGQNFRCNLFSENGCEGESIVVTTNEADLKNKSMVIKGVMCHYPVEKKVTKRIPSILRNTVFNICDKNIDTLTATFFTDINYQGTAKGIAISAQNHCYTIGANDFVIGSFKGSMSGGQKYVCQLFAAGACSGIALLVTTDVPDLGKYRNNIKSLKCTWGSSSNEIASKDVVPVPRSATFEAANALRVINFSVCSGTNYTGVCDSFSVLENDCQLLGDDQVTSFNASRPLGGKWSCFLEPNLKCQPLGGFGTTVNVPDLGHVGNKTQNFTNQVHSVKCFAWDTVSIAEEQITPFSKTTALKSRDTSHGGQLQTTWCSEERYAGSCLDIWFNESTCYHFGSAAEYSSFKAVVPYTGYMYSCALKTGNNCDGDGITVQVDQVSFDSGRLDNKIHSASCTWGPVKQDATLTNPELIVRNVNDDAVVVTFCQDMDYKGICTDSAIHNLETTCVDIRFSSGNEFDSFKQRATGAWTGRLFSCTLFDDQLCQGVSHEVTSDISDLQHTYRIWDLRGTKSVKCNWLDNGEIVKDFTTILTVDLSTRDIDNSIVIPITKDYIATIDFPPAEQTTTSINNTATANADPNSFFIEFCPLVNYEGDCFGFTIPADKSCHKTYLEGRSTHPWQSFRGYASKAWSCFMYKKVDCKDSNAVILESGTGANGVSGDPNFGQWWGQIVAVKC